MRNLCGRVGESGITGERYVWHTSDMEHYAAAERIGCENILIEPDMSTYEIHNWNNFFMTYHPWAIFLPEKVSSLYRNDPPPLPVKFIWFRTAYDDSHQERMELMEHTEVTYELEPGRSDGKKKS